MSRLARLRLIYRVRAVGVSLIYTDKPNVIRSRCLLSRPNAEKDPPIYVLGLGVVQVLQPHLNLEYSSYASKVEASLAGESKRKKEGKQANETSLHTRNMYLIASRKGGVRAIWTRYERSFSSDVSAQ